jgi:hypothetical protein
VPFGFAQDRESVERPVERPVERQMMVCWQIMESELF